MNTVEEIKIEKYYNVLTDLHNILSKTDRISMEEFCVTNNISQNAPKVLTRGGIIKCKRKGRYSLWKWTTIQPTKRMAVKCIKLIANNDSPRKSQQLKLNVEENTNTKTKVVTKRRRKVVEPVPVKETKKLLFSLFWGLFKIEIC